MREAALLRALGAQSSILYTGLWVEFALLGAIAGTIGALIAAGVGWSLSHFVFQLSIVCIQWVYCVYSVGVLCVFSGCIWCSQWVYLV